MKYTVEYNNIEVICQVRAYFNSKLWKRVHIGNWWIGGHMKVKRLFNIFQYKKRWNNDVFIDKLINLLCKQAYERAKCMKTSNICLGPHPVERSRTTFPQSKKTTQKAHAIFRNKHINAFNCKTYLMHFVSRGMKICNYYITVPVDSLKILLNR